MRFSAFLPGAGGALIVSPLAALASEAAAIPASMPVDVAGEAVRVIGYLLLFMALAVLAVRLGRKYVPRMGGEGVIRVEDGRNFAPGVGVRLIRVGGRAWLLGVSRDGVSLLAEMRPEDLAPTGEGKS